MTPYSLYHWIVSNYVSLLLTTLLYFSSASLLAGDGFYKRAVSSLA